MGTKTNNSEEIFLGLVGAVGTNLEEFSKVIYGQLLAYDYVTEVVQLTDILPKIFPNGPDYGQSEFKRISHYMDMGNRLRDDSKENRILAMHAMAKISKFRKEQPNVQRRAFILKSLKHPSEVKLLRKVYGDSFYLIGLHKTMEKRTSYLTEVKSLSDDQANKLIDRDRNEDIKHGQKLRDSYQLSDVFIDGSDYERMFTESKRFIEILFGSPYHTPNLEEHNMFQAYAASLKSSDLSRQVGAIIVSKCGDIISQGTNDVPKAQGGLYSNDDKLDKRDFKIGYDSNERRRNDIINNIVKSVEPRLSELQVGALKDALNTSDIKDITEYGRAVHAEMEALLSAARVGVSVRGGTLYTTTFPCHNCTKHIVAAGIMRIVYIEPYPKSLAKELHKDSISIDKKDDRLVSFLPFLGVGPRRYFDLFSLKLGSGREVERKNSDGKVIDFESQKQQINLRLSEKSITYTKEELANIAVFSKKLKSLN